MIIFRRILYLFLFFLNSLSDKVYPDVTVLCYHSVSKNNWYFSTDPDIFKKQIQQLRKSFQFISYSEFKKFMSGSFHPEKPALLLTFDDGYEDLVRIAPYLESQHIYPIAFVLSDPFNANRIEMDNNYELLNDPQIKILQKHGWTIGAHTATHPDLTTLSKSEIELEITQSKKTLLKKFGSCEVLAYPKGKYTDSVLAIAKKAGFQFGFSMNDTIITPQSNHFTIPRVGINRSHSYDELIALLSFFAIKFRKLVKTFL